MRRAVGSIATVGIVMASITGCGFTQSGHNLSPNRGTTTAANVLSGASGNDGTSGNVTVSPPGQAGTPHSSDLSGTGNDTGNSTESPTNAVGNQTTGSTKPPANATGNSKPEPDTGSAQTEPLQHLVPEVYEVPKGDVALTIDDGPSPYTEQIIQILKKYHVKATFFFVGSRVKIWPDAVRDAYLAGDGIGDHTVDHPQLNHLTPAQQAWEINQAAADIQTEAPEAITLFRPPYEIMTNAMEATLQRDHMALALWNRDPRDWAATSPQQIIDRIVNGDPSGAVFDMHDIKLTMLALPTIIQDLQAKHLHLVVLQAPAGYTGILPGSPPGGSQGKGSGENGSEGKDNSNATGGTTSGTTNGVGNGTPSGPQNAPGGNPNGA